MQIMFEPFFITRDKRIEKPKDALSFDQDILALEALRKPLGEFFSVSVVLVEQRVVRRLVRKFRVVDRVTSLDHHQSSFSQLRPDNTLLLPFDPAAFDPRLPQDP